MPIRVAINGFGRIGRNIFRAYLSRKSNLQFVAVNDLTNPETLAHLLQYDSVYGRLGQNIQHTSDSIIVDERPLRVFAERDPSRIPWELEDVDIVIESTGLFRSRDDANSHLRGPVQKVVITAPGKDPDITLALGVNEQDYDPERHHIISNASCTTNCLAPVAKILHEAFGIRKGLMTTIHSYTNGQRILDLPHKDLRRARAAALSMIPTTTGAAAAVALVLPAMKGILDGISIRVPTATVSMVDLTATLKTSVGVDEVKNAFEKASNGPLKGILHYTEEELVSCDYSGDSHSAIVDGPFIRMLGGNMVKVLAWYDNEWGYSNRVFDLTEMISRNLGKPLHS